MGGGPIRILPNAMALCPKMCLLCVVVYNYTCSAPCEPPLLRPSPLPPSDTCRRLSPRSCTPRREYSGARADSAATTETHTGVNIFHSERVAAEGRADPGEVRHALDTRHDPTVAYCPPPSGFAVRRGVNTYMYK